MALIDAGGEHIFEGEVRGTITTEPRGGNGFGYDPVFLPEMSDLTFAELDAKMKNAISHRGQAVWKWCAFFPSVSARAEKHSVHHCVHRLGDGGSRLRPASWGRCSRG